MTYNFWKIFAYFWGIPISKINFQWLLPEIRYIKRSTEENIKENEL